MKPALWGAQCEQCPINKVRGENLPVSIDELDFPLMIRQLRVGGYPFKAEDLDLEDWLLQGIIEEEIELSRVPRIEPPPKAKPEDPAIGV